ncbi:hypothetical protein AXG93_773s1890 [Marchantia polymorpha subsp. ruderalis]|uniref:Uncharacterized protein n=1 Tax=Marchantia polymorpha subsp. ruderalis TaxID=1480154 RepID=A0A176W9X5_MARPO|nr:hypothetical protein AXG93_773s1890 [Marchantia polymorpha subsp. ruderalis]
MGTPDHAREPCPDRILDDIGGAFSMGAVGGSAWHFIRGMKNSPRGERLLGGSQAVRINAPRIGGSFAVWGVFGGVLLALIEGAGIMLNRLTANMAQPPPLEEPMPQMNMPGAPYATPSPYSGQATTFNVPDSPPVPVNLGAPSFEERKLDSDSGIVPPPTDPTSGSSGGSSWWGGLFGGKKEEEGFRA